jgi:hypothetical protein
MSVQFSGNERPVYIELIVGFQIDIRGGARPFKLRGGSINQNETLKIHRI